MFCNRFFYRSHPDLPNQQKTTRPAKKSIFLIAFFMAVLIAGSASAASVTLAWDPNEPGPEGYMLFIRLAGDTYNYSAPALIAATTSCRVEGLVPGNTYYMIVRAYEGSAQSGDSNEIAYTPSAD
ncbi:MAG: fibronectin type III domain-containing protein [Proteobacteria bacterium]|nr:fibronectin type III domain-containing protein [Pseudomonadota bacterium]MBU1389825.1 fibronectin type III domain-containing protein [Pseudomonadota bacterium]MBU1543834.1 fibronectin type III domain-containing protein [Pseudomonadota bacterium]MBU2430396.1 fibronectin type III domain-containing protein [Pseudomonadota bacterium]MBU2482367.1 fibronectin type III domain-containing protein [Pseudomonadota bacterium]